MKKDRFDATITISIVGFILAALLVAADEIFDLPHLIFNSPPTMVNWTEIVIEIVLVIIVGAFTISYMGRLASKRKQAEGHVVHLNTVLRAIRNVNQLITKVKDRENLLQGVCDNLTKTRGYNSAWIAFLDDGGGFLAATHAGFSEGFSRLVELLKQVKSPRCIQQILEQSSISVVANPDVECGGCPLVGTYAGKARMIARLEYKGRVYGFLTVTVPIGLAVDEEEQSLFGEVADDIAFALNAIELEAKRKKAEEALRESEEKFRNLMESAPIGIAVSNAEGVISDVNPAVLKIFGYDSKEDFLRVPAPSLYYDPKDREQFVKLLEEKDSGRDFEARLKHKDGTLIWIALSSILKKDEAETPQFVHTFQDISERKQAEEALQKAHDELEMRVEERTAELQNINKELEAFSYSVSHDLRAPLRAIDGFSKILLEDYSNTLDEQGQHYLQRVRVGTQNMGQLIDAMLTLSRVGRQPVNKQTSDIATIAQKAYNSLEAEWKNRDVHFIVHRCPPVSSDAALMRIVFDNLLSNALKFTQNRATAEIEVGCCKIEDKQPVFFVKDNGTGFDMKYADNLFAPFQRLHSAEKYKGLGIGLVTVQRVILLHNGQIWVESEPDVGTTFYFTLQGGES